MDPNQTAMERAFELAASGEVLNLTALRRKLRFEGYHDDQLVGTVVRQLRKLLDKAHAKADPPSV